MSNGVNKIILGFVGPLASGKGAICQYLKEKHGASVFRFSTMLRDVLNRLYLEISRDNMQNLSSALRQTFGDDLLASVIANDVKNEKNEFIVIDGVRREPDIKYLKDFPNFYLIEIKADQKIRWERMRKRGENTDIILNNLFVHTQLQTIYGINMVALVDGQPKTLTLK